MGNLKEFLVRAQDAVADAPDHMRTAARSLRVLLIQPPATGCVRSLLPQLEEGTDGIGFKPPLGILYVATNVHRHSIHEIRIVDAQAQHLEVADLARLAREFQPDLVGISAWTDWWYPAYETGRAIKEAVPGTHLTYGGPHIAIYPDETLALPFVDSVIVGDGEIPFLFLANMLSNGKLDGSLPGLHLKHSGVKLPPDDIYVHGDLDGLAQPDRTLLPIEIYGSVLSKGDYVTTMITSRGCPHRCTFCKLNFQKNIARSADSVIQEFRDIAALGIREVEIYDDTFTWGRQRLREICERVIAEKIDIEWAVRDRVSKADPDLLRLMQRAGCRRIHFGIESGVQHVIDRMKKQITLDQARRAVRAAKDAGLTVLTYFMFGNLDETLEDMRATVDFALELNADYSEFSITIPYAGTEMYDEGLASGVIKRDYWREYAVNPTANFMPPELIENNASLEQMLEVRNDAVRRFYFRPKYMLRELFRVNTLPEFIRKTRMGLRLAHSVYAK